ncbi:hypothetical protein SB00610_00611 [Klebsiella quasipneumoniae subsp. similipneumoniae]|nr:hypothetical protein SB00610_00611 [Klebsiella quasipneumoniae subsp. similipneumoniae]
MSQRDASGIAIQHRRQPPAHATLVNRHRFIRGKGADNLAFVAFANPLKIQFIMVTQPVDEAASVRRGHHCLQRLHYRGGALLRQADIEIFIKPKIEHHLQPIAAAEIMAIIFHFHVHFTQQYRVGIEALHDLPEMRQQRVAPRLVALPGLLHQM